MAIEETNGGTFQAAFGQLCKLTANNLGFIAPVGTDAGDVTPIVCDDMEVWLVLAQATVTDDTLSDRTSLLYNIPQAGANEKFYLDKLCGQLWVEQVQLSNTHGTLFPEGFDADCPLFVGFQADWSKIMNLFGVGLFRIRTELDSFGSTNTFYSQIYFVQAYSKERANHTIRLDWNLRGTHPRQDGVVGEIDYCKMDFYESIRVWGDITYDGDDFEEENIKYPTGYVSYTDQEDIPNYNLSTLSLPEWQRDIIKRALRSNGSADKNFVNGLRATDYSIDNDTTIKNKLFRKAGKLSVGDRHEALNRRQIEVPLKDRIEYFETKSNVV
jgi:hypothetical protein